MNLQKAKKVLKVSYRVLLFEFMRYKFLYNSYLHKALFHPTSATFNITNNCIGKCITCNAWKQKSTNELMTNEVIDILYQLRRLNISNVGFAGGEPLLRNDLSELVRKSNELGFKLTSIITNGLLLDESKVDSLLKSGLTGIGISIDGINDIHDMIRGINGAYQRSLSALETVVKLRNEKYPYLYIWVSTTLMKPNLRQIEDIIKICKLLNIRMSLNLLDTSPYFLSGIDISNLIIKDKDELDMFIDRLHKIKKRFPSVLNQDHVSIEYARKHFCNSARKDIPCCMGYQNIYIGPHGDVYSGCWVLKPLGNLRTKKLDEIINSDEYKKRIYDMFMKKCPGCTCGYSTNLTYHIPSIYEEVLYRCSLARK